MDGVPKLETLARAAFARFPSTPRLTCERRRVDFEVLGRRAGTQARQYTIAHVQKHAHTECTQVNLSRVRKHARAHKQRQPAMQDYS